MEDRRPRLSGKTGILPVDMLEACLP